MLSKRIMSEDEAVITCHFASKERNHWRCETPHLFGRLLPRVQIGTTPWDGNRYHKTGHRLRETAHSPRERESHDLPDILYVISVGGVARGACGGGEVFSSVCRLARSSLSRSDTHTLPRSSLLALSSHFAVMFVVSCRKMRIKARLEDDR